MNHLLDQAAALRELSEEVGCETEGLAEKYYASGNLAAVSSELAAMKVWLGLEGHKSAETEILPHFLHFSANYL